MLRHLPSLATILLIATNESRREMLRQRLEALGYSVLLVTAEQPLARLLDLGRCDLIVLDGENDPPDAELTAQLTELMARGIPVLTLTAEGQANREWYEETMGVRVTMALRNRTVQHLINERLERWNGMNVLDDGSLLFSRGYCEALLPVEIERARRTYQPLALVLLNFQGIPPDPEPTYWQVLSAHVISCIRQIDIPARFGQELVLLVLPITEAHNARVSAQRVLSGLKELVGLPGPPLTGTAGIAAYPVHGETPAALLSAVHRSLTYAFEPGTIISFDQI